jgi:hypothetical protein
MRAAALRERLEARLRPPPFPVLPWVCFHSHLPPGRTLQCLTLCHSHTRVYGTPLGVLPGTYPIPMNVTGPGGSGVGTLLGSLTLEVCVQPASAYTPPYLVTGLDPVVVAPFGVGLDVDLRVWLRLGAGGSIVSVTGRSGGSLPTWLAYNVASGRLQGLPIVRGDHLVDVRFAVNGVPADLLTLVVTVPKATAAPCPAGTFSAGGAGTCTPCAVGSFNSGVGQAACTTCPPYTTSTVVGATTCLPECPAQGQLSMG